MVSPLHTSSLISILTISLLLSFKTLIVTAQSWPYFLIPHNVARAELGLKPLKWDSRVASYAHWYANQRKGDCQLIHSNGPYGENLFWGSGVGWSPQQVVAAWVQEKPQYDYNSNSCHGMCGHYTQVVWKSTRRLGCAMATCDNGRGTFVVCSYDPPGNYVGIRPY
ncbi:hypothetical protein LUZ60_000756 [Juncus effusus]|nr:hypothetical protein LUZ60_000756 [Juncus effusus]